MMPTPRTSPAAQPVISRKRSKQPQFYVPIPQRLITLLSDTPLRDRAVRPDLTTLFRCARLGPAFARRHSSATISTLKEGAVKRALDRLMAGGVDHPETPGA